MSVLVDVFASLHPGLPGASHAVQYELVDLVELSFGHVCVLVVFDIYTRGSLRVT